MAEQSGEKTQEATPHRQEQAREQGQGRLQPRLKLCGLADRGRDVVEVLRAKYRFDGWRLHALPAQHGRIARPQKF